MENKAFLRFDEFTVFSSDLKAIPDDQAAFLSVLVACYDDVNILLRMYISYATEVESPAPAKEMSLKIKMFLARTLSSKLFEAVELLRGKQSWNETKDEMVKAFSANALKELDLDADNLGFRIAQTLRAEVDSHFSVRAAKKNLIELENGVEHKIYAHKTEGNSFSTLGENVVFNERFRLGRLPGDMADGAEYFGKWLDWSSKATSWLHSVCANALIEFLPEEALSRIKRNQVYWLDERLVGDMEDRASPLFFRERRS